MEVYQFLSTPSVGRATWLPILMQRDVTISIHALRGEGDPETAGRAGGRRISIHALRGEGDGGGHNVRDGHWISIHALRGEGDAAVFGRSLILFDFYPRPPWGGRPSQRTPEP